MSATRSPALSLLQRLAPAAALGIGIAAAMAPATTRAQATSSSELTHLGLIDQATIAQSLETFGTYKYVENKKNPPTAPADIRQAETDRARDLNVRDNVVSVTQNICKQAGARGLAACTAIAASTPENLVVALGLAGALSEQLQNRVATGNQSASTTLSSFATALTDLSANPAAATPAQPRNEAQAAQVRQTPARGITQVQRSGTAVTDPNADRSAIAANEATQDALGRLDRYAQGRPNVQARLAKAYYDIANYACAALTAVRVADENRGRPDGHGGLTQGGPTGSIQWPTQLRACFRLTPDGQPNSYTATREVMGSLSDQVALTAAAAKESDPRLSTGMKIAAGIILSSVSDLERQVGASLQQRPAVPQGSMPGIPQLQLPPAAANKTAHANLDYINGMIETYPDIQRGMQIAYGKAYINTCNVTQQALSVCSEAGPRDYQAMYGLVSRMSNQVAARAQDNGLPPPERAQYADIASQFASYTAVSVTAVVNKVREKVAAAYSK